MGKQYVCFALLCFAFAFVLVAVKYYDLVAMALEDYDMSASLVDLRRA